MTDYDKIFNDDVNKEFYFNAPGYGGRKLMVGAVSLNNAIERLKKDEYYTLVTYIDGEKLPEEYIPLDEKLDSGDLLATVNPKNNLQYICQNSGSIQKISELSNLNYLLGPGPDTFNLTELVEKQVAEIKAERNQNKTIEGAGHQI
ncbi:MAG: hypothetical protein IJI58_04000 [Bacilli bacterium]|nr:hypothetical protein [Bacilli bacterium]